MSSLFALLLSLGLLLTAALAFVGERFRRRLRWALRASLVFVWAAFGVSLWKIAERTSMVLVTPGVQRHPQFVDSALGQLLTLLISLGGPAAFVTFLGVWALRATAVNAGAPQKKARKKHAAKLSEVLSAGKDLEDVRRLFEEYARALDFDLGFPLQGFQNEVRALPGAYTPPRGRLLIARIGGLAAGCVAIREVAPGITEMKRLYVRPDFRHAGLGRTLVATALATATELGSTSVRLDTLPAMREAIGLYRSLGFIDRGPFGDPPTPGAIFLEWNAPQRRR